MSRNSRGSQVPETMTSFSSFAPSSQTLGTLSSASSPSSSEASSLRSLIAFWVALGRSAALTAEPGARMDVSAASTTRIRLRIASSLFSFFGKAVRAIRRQRAPAESEWANPHGYGKAGLRLERPPHRIAAIEAQVLPAPGLAALHDFGRFLGGGITRLDLDPVVVGVEEEPIQYALLTLVP